METDHSGTSSFDQLSDLCARGSVDAELAHLSTCLHVGVMAPACSRVHAKEYALISKELYEREQEK